MADLNKNELETMRILWEESPLKPADIQDRFQWPIENATLRSVLRQLVEDGQATRRKQGKAFFYRPKAKRRAALRRMGARMADVFTGGSTAGLIAELLKSQKLRPEEITELRRIADEVLPSDEGEE